MGNTKRSVPKPTLSVFPTLSDRAELLMPANICTPKVYFDRLASLANVNALAGEDEDEDEYWRHPKKETMSWAAAHAAGDPSGYQNPFHMHMKELAIMLALCDSSLTMESSVNPHGSTEEPGKKHEPNPETEMGSEDETAVSGEDSEPEDLPSEICHLGARIGATISRHAHGRINALRKTASEPAKSIAQEWRQEQGRMFSKEDSADPIKPIDEDDSSSDESSQGSDSTTVKAQPSRSKKSKNLPVHMSWVKTEASGAWSELNITYGGRSTSKVGTKRPRNTDFDHEYGDSHGNEVSSRPKNPKCSKKTVKMATGVSNDIHRGDGVTPAQEANEQVNGEAMDGLSLEVDSVAEDSENSEDSDAEDSEDSEENKSDACVSACSGNGWPSEEGMESEAESPWLQ